MLADIPAPRPVVSSEHVFEGKVWDVRSDRVDLGDDRIVQRDYIFHTGAVAIIALNDAGEIYLVRQYRHPVRAECWEPPAGLTDVAAESPVEAAARELCEEADLTAGRWDVLVDFYATPGGSSEGIRVFLARDLAPVPEDERHVRTDEERDMEGRWVPLEDALAAVWAGRASSPTLVIGTLALDAARRAGWSTLRPADAPWRKPPSLER